MQSLPSELTPPSGRQYEIGLGEQRAVIAEVGAALRLYAVGGRDVVVPFGEDEIAPAYHGAVLLPWPNRLRDGQYTFDGRDYQVAVTEPARQTALHGLVCWERWGLVEHTQTAVRLVVDIVPTPGYPFPVRAEIDYELTDEGLEITVTATNLGTRAAPYGVGFHPWLSPGAGSLDDCVLRLDAEAWIATDERLLPTGVAALPGEFDFRRPRLLGSTALDDAFVDATYVDGRSRVLLTGADGRTAAIWMDESLPCWQLCTGDGIDAAAYVRTGLAAEPMTCVADAFRTGDNLIKLAPGQKHTVHWGLTLR